MASKRRREGPSPVQGAAFLRSLRAMSAITLEGIEIENFRAYQDPQYFPLAPVTLIFGANSAGKTTLFNALGMLRQTKGQYGDRGTGKISVRGSSVDLGIASEVPNRNNPNGEMAIRIFASPREIERNTGPSLYAIAALEYLVENQQARFGIGVRFKLMRPEVGVSYLQITGYELYLGTDPTPILVFGRDEKDGAVLQERAEYKVIKCNEAHSYWDWFVRQYGTKVLIQRAGSNLLAVDDIQYFPRELPELDPSLKQDSALSKYYVELHQALLQADYTEEEVDEEGYITVRNPLRDELFMATYGHGGGTQMPQDEAISKPAPVGDKSILRDIARKLPLTDEVVKELSVLLIKANTSDDKSLSAGIDWTPLFYRGRPGRMFGPMRAQLDISGFERSLSSVAEVPSPFLNEFLVSAAGRIAIIIENMETISARRGEFRRTFILGESEKAGELDVATAAKSHMDRMNQALRDAKVPFTYDVRVFTPETQGIADELRIGAVEVYDSVGRPKNIADVGTGTQYLLPVALAISDQDRGLLAIQEPESHLHPSLQSAVASLIASSIADSKYPVLVETHSEAILRKFIDHVGGEASPKIPASSISVLYVSRSGEASSVRSIRVADDGRLLDGWPEGAKKEGFHV